MKFMRLNQLQKVVQETATQENVTEGAGELISRFNRLIGILSEDFITPEILAIEPTEWEWIKEQLLLFPEGPLWKALKLNTNNIESYYNLEHLLLNLSPKREGEVFV